MTTHTTIPTIVILILFSLVSNTHATDLNKLFLFVEDSMTFSFHESIPEEDWGGLETTLQTVNGVTYPRVSEFDVFICYSTSPDNTVRMQVANILMKYFKKKKIKFQ